MVVLKDVKAPLLLKYNLDALLTARGQSRKDLAVWCRRTESWLSQIFTKDERGIPLKYLDRMADFFGIATYQLFQPGISHLTERRAGFDRRAGKDRRISRAVLSEKRGDVDLMDVFRALSQEGRESAKAMLADILNTELRGPRTRGSTADGGDRRTGTKKATNGQKKTEHG